MLYDTRAKRIAFLRKRGNIVTFKLLLEQNIIDRLEDSNGLVSLVFQDKSYTPLMKMDELLSLIAWDTMERWHKG